MKYVNLMLLKSNDNISILRRKSNNGKTQIKW